MRMRAGLQQGECRGSHLGQAGRAAVSQKAAATQQAVSAGPSTLDVRFLRRLHSPADFAGSTESVADRTRQHGLLLLLPPLPCRPRPHTLACAPHRAPLIVGVLGCMAERLKSKLLDQQKLADLVVGPDAYRDLPRIIAAVQVRRSSPTHTLQGVSGPQPSGVQGLGFRVSVGSKSGAVPP